MTYDANDVRHGSLYARAPMATYLWCVIYVTSVIITAPDICHYQHVCLNDASRARHREPRPTTPYPRAERWFSLINHDDRRAP